MLAVSSWVLLGIGTLLALVVFVGTSWNGVRQHEIETGYLYAVPLPLVAALLAGALLWFGWRDTSATRCLLTTLPVLLLSGLIVVVAILFCIGIFQ